ncbi:hypothetical protein [Nakamurella sp.]|uniref:hypothetical protein n=1 Tax=Nakamurella sp. TaxID=1869182 RepID=UPI003B3B4A5E
MAVQFKVQKPGATDTVTGVDGAAISDDNTLRLFNGTTLVRKYLPWSWTTVKWEDV